MIHRINWNNKDFIQIFFSQSTTLFFYVVTRENVSC